MLGLLGMEGEMQRSICIVGPELLCPGEFSELAGWLVSALATSTIFRSRVSDGGRFALGNGKSQGVE